MLYYLIVYAFANVGAFAVAAWLVRDKDSDNIDDLNGLGYQEPLLATCILVLMLSLIGIPPLAGFFGKLYVFMEALNQPQTVQPVTLIWLVALGLLNSVVSAFYYVRVLKAMFLREPGEKRLAPASRAIAVPIVLGTIVVVIFGLMPGSLMSVMQAAAVPMLTQPVTIPPIDAKLLKPRPKPSIPDGATVLGPAKKIEYTPEQLEFMKQPNKGQLRGPGMPGSARCQEGGRFPRQEGWRSREEGRRQGKAPAPCNPPLNPEGKEAAARGPAARSLVSPGSKPSR